MSSSAELRRQLAAGWASMGAEDSMQLVEAPDADEDESGDPALAQLTMQIEYNNSLLEQMQELELSQLRSQKDLQAKQRQLRDALDAVETLRADLGVSRRDSNKAREVAAACSDEANRAKIESGVAARKADGLLKFAEEAKDEIATLRHDLEVTQRELEMAREKVESARDDRERTLEDERSQAADARLKNEELAREAARARAAVSPLEAELAAERRRAAELADALADRGKEMRALREEAAGLKAIADDAVRQAEAARSFENALKQELEAKDEELSRAKTLVSSARDVSESVKSDSEGYRRKHERALEQIREAEEENADLKTQLEALANDLQAQIEARREDRERAERKREELAADLGTMAEESRSRERAAAEEAAAREASVLRQRKEWEVSVEGLRDENRRLSQLLTRQKGEFEARGRDAEDERADFAARLAEAAGRARAAEQRLHDAESAEAKDACGVRDALVEARTALTRRTKVHVDTLGALEDALRTQTAECSKLRQAHDNLADEVSVLKSRVREDPIGAALEDWRDDTKASLEQFARKAETAKRDAAEARRAQIAAELARDEEKSRTFMLEEERARLEEELVGLQDRVRAFDVSASERLKSARAECESAVAARRELEDTVRGLTKELTAASSENRKLQEEAERRSHGANDAATASRKRGDELERELAETAAALRAAEQRAQRAIEEHALMKKKLAASAEDVAMQAGELRAAEQKLAAAASGSTSDAAKAKEIARARDTVRKMETQLKQTKSIVSILQEQRTHLSAENASLREELDAHTKKDLSLLEDTSML